MVHAAEMDTLTVWTFPTAEGADEGGRPAPVARPREAGSRSTTPPSCLGPPRAASPTIAELGSLAGPGALWGGFWGLLLGLIFLVPLAGLALGAGAGAVAGGLVDVGIDDAFIKRIRAEVAPGTSAAFILSHGATADTVAEALRDLDLQLLRSNLSADEEEQLRAMFADDEARAGHA